MLEDFINAFGNFRSKKLRTVLSLLGIAIGVTVVTVISNIPARVTAFLRMKVVGAHELNNAPAVIWRHANHSMGRLTTAITVTCSIDSSAADGSVGGSATLTFEKGATAYDALVATNGIHGIRHI